jgi:nucleoside-diphosphate kinase
LAPELIPAETDSIKLTSQFGLTDTRNTTHGSDSDATARNEIKFFFPDFDADQVLLKLSARSLPESNSGLFFDDVNFVHRL